MEGLRAKISKEHFLRLTLESPKVIKRLLPAVGEVLPNLKGFMIVRNLVLVPLYNYAVRYSSSFHVISMFFPI